MRTSQLLSRAIAVMVFAALPLTGGTAHAAAPSGPASSADAFGLLVDVRLLPTHTPVRLGPVARASQESPPSSAGPDSAQALEAGPVPAGGELVQHVGVMTSIANAGAAPLAVASSQVNDVSLLRQGGTSLITADTVRAQSNSDCSTEPNGVGTTFVNLEINGTPITETPAPNTVIDLVFAKVILNEQRPAFDGRGWVVNAIHVISTTQGDPLIRGDIVVAHAMSTVSCTNGAGTTGGDNAIKFVKTAEPSVAKTGQQVVYTAKVTNDGVSPCLVTSFTDHLPAPFDFVATAGDFGDALDAQVIRPGGGVDLVLGNGKTLGVGETFTQTFTVRVRDDALPAVYYNNLEIFCANLGNFVKGLDAPVQVTEEVVPSPTPTPSASPSASVTPQPPPCRPLPDTGASGLWPLAAVGAAAAALGSRRAARRAGGAGTAPEPEDA